MRFDGQTVLGYQLPKLVEQADLDIPLTPKELEVWLANFPSLNLQLLTNHIPKYIQDLNRVTLSDKRRLEMLEILRPMVMHIYQALAKKLRGMNLTLSDEFQETQWVASIMMAEMAIGYQRLLFNLAIRNPSLFDRGQYVLLAQRAVYYLGEKICLSYLLSLSVPERVWRDINATYAYTCKLKLNAKKVNDDVAYFESNRGTIDDVFKRVLLLTIISPYALRSAELEQVYYGLSPWFNEIKLVKLTESEGDHYTINLEQDMGPEFQNSVSAIEDEYHIDCTKILENLRLWLETGSAPRSASSKGMSKKLLIELITKLDGSSRCRLKERIVTKGDRVEVIIGVDGIELFLSKLGESSSDESDSAWMNDESRNENDNLLHFYTPEDVSKQKMDSVSTIENKNSAEQHHAFDIKNESEQGVCLSCSHLHGAGLYIGELMLIRGFEPEIWTLGIVRWMTLLNKRVEVGLYLLSTCVEQVVIRQQGVETDATVNALWLVNSESGDTLLLPSAEFETGDKLQVNHNNEMLDITLSESVWSSEGFSQFSVILAKREPNSDEV